MEHLAISDGAWARRKNRPLPSAETAKVRKTSGDPKRKRKIQPVRKRKVLIPRSQAAETVPNPAVAAKNVPAAEGERHRRRNDPQANAKILIYVRKGLQFGCLRDKIVFRENKNPRDRSRV